MTRSTISWLAGAAGALLSAGSGAHAATHAVPGAYSDIGAALAASATGDTVLVAPGTYSGTANRDLSFAGKDVTLRSSGGAAATVLQYSGAAAIVPPILTLDGGEGAGARIEGFTFRHGTADGVCLVLVSASPVVSDCVFEGGLTSAVTCSGTAAPVFRRCVFQDNAASAGAGVESVGASPAFEDCAFVRNAATDGGAVWASGGAPVFSGCSFRENTASSDGGALFLTLNPVSITASRFLDNSAVSLGGAVYVNSGDGTIDASLFARNDAVRGGALRNRFGSDLLITGSTFSGNSSHLPNGAHFSIRGSASMQFDQCILAFAPAGVSGELVATGGTVSMNCTDIFGNAGGDWVSTWSGEISVNGNLSEDPHFCDVPAGNYAIRSDSPCAPAASACGLIGAIGVMCGPINVESSSWGAVKAAYR